MNTQEFVKKLIKPDFRVTTAIHNAISEYSYLDMLKDTNLPLLYLLGKEDEQLPQYWQTIEAIQSNINPVVQHGMFDKAGHLLNLDMFDDFNTVVMNYLNFLYVKKANL